MEEWNVKKSPSSESHMHIFMNGVNYKEAVKLQQNGPNEEVIRNHFGLYQKRGITWIRDGGDIYGASVFAKTIAEEYGITYRTPVFALHKEGHYGGIVGHGFETMKEYHGWIKEIRAQRGDFVKIMISGIMDFDHGGLTEDPLTKEEIREMIHIAHEEGYAVMAHANGSQAVIAAAEAGVDSVEHGNFCNEEALLALAESQAIWVPTIVTVKNLLGDDRFPKRVIQEIWEGQQKNLEKAYQYGVKLALGSDAGAYRVLHGQGIQDEYETFQKILEPEDPAWEQRIQEGERILKNKF